MEKIMFHIAIAQFFNVAFTFHQGLLNFLSVKKAGGTHFLLRESHYHTFLL